MTLNNIGDLNSMHVDVLTELGNIGTGNAVTSLATLVGKEISINVPRVRILDFNESVQFIGGAENIVTGVLIRLIEGIEGMILYIFEDKFVATVLKTFFGKEFKSALEINEMDKSALNEIGNIMAGAYARALSSMTGLKITLSTPSICVDMAGAILSVPAIEFASIGDKVLFIEDSFGIGNDMVNSNMILVPELDSLNLLFKKLGVGI
ncbi:MAG: chemotaxis protein CheC [Clostridiales bacterium]|jgi:chemotaxis protein CheC|nr:chemotaxis protein CheC [Clostridiales bacterium]